MRRANVLTLCLTVLASLPAGAAVFTVTTNADSGPGSLREAITQANLSDGPHTIGFDADYTITLASALPTIDASTTITIEGNGWDRTIIDGGNPPGGSAGVSAFDVEGTLILDGVGLQNCYHQLDGGAVTVDFDATFKFLNSRAEANISSFYGGAVLSYGTVDIEDSLFSSNQAYQGGGLYLTGASTVARTTLVNNVATNLGGGGITNWNGTLTVSQCLFWDNQSNSRGGGALQTWVASGQTTVENSTFFDNSGTDGGAVSCEYSGGTTLRGVTVTANVGTNGGGVNCPNLEIEASIFYRNAATTGPDLFGAVESLGFNLIGITTGATIGGDTATNLVGVDPFVGPPADNGGPTNTCALGQGSPAIDAGPPDCAGLTVDQRGYPRPSNGDLIGAAVCDIGAFEVNVIFADGFESGDTLKWSSTVP